ncbi:HAD family phosphatase [Actinoplanes sp. NPDC051470]|uniref:HAD family hydrolase n=1 Tax=unclassified Actinoplanes TaxID=2626549 RepID=UPI0034497FF2
MSVEAVVFDLDGVIIDSEETWEEVRRGYVAAHGREFLPDTQTRMMGMSTGEWSRHLAEDVGVGLPPEQVASEVLAAMAGRYRDHLPLIPGAVDAVRRIAAVYPVALASSSARVLIDSVMAASGLDSVFQVVLSTEEVPRGKPAPDVYLLAAAKLGFEPTHCAGIEDSSNGLRAVAAAGMKVVCVPHGVYPPADDALAQAALVVPSLAELSVDAIAAL